MVEIERTINVYIGQPKLMNWGQISYLLYTHPTRSQMEEFPYIKFNHWRFAREGSQVALGLLSLAAFSASAYLWIAELETRTSQVLWGVAYGIMMAYPMALFVSFRKYVGSLEESSILAPSPDLPKVGKADMFVPRASVLSTYLANPGQYPTQ